MATNATPTTPSELVDNYDVIATGIDTGSERFELVLERAIEHAVTMLATNLRSPYSDPDPDDHSQYVMENALNPENVRDVEVHDRQLADARVTIWLRDAPIWANEAESKKIIVPRERDDCQTVIDVREF